MIRKDKDEKRVSYDEVAKGLNQGFTHADPARIAGLAQLQRVRAVKGESLQREEARLAQKLGAEHPRVVALKQKREANRAIERDLELGLSRARTPAVFPEANAWTLHGHVRNGARKGVAGMTIALFDERKQWIEEAGHACTDADGYFRLTVKVDKTVKRDTDIAGAKSAAASGATFGIAAGGGSRGIFIHVTDKQGNKRFIDKDSLDPKLDEVVYREIVIDDDADECTPPGGKPSDKPEKEGRYLGNKNNFELHDLNNTKPGCQIDEIKPARRQYFGTQKEALDAGYDFCAHCFGKTKSKR